jgi:hypothetical protein
MPLPVPTNNPPHSPDYVAGWTFRGNATPAAIAGWRDYETALAAVPPVVTPPVIPPTPPVAPPAPPVIVVGPSPYPVQIVQQNENLPALIGAATASVCFRLAPGPWNIFGQAAPKIGHLQLDASAAVLHWTLPTGGPADPAFCIRAAQPGIEVFGGEWHTPATPIEILADGCTFRNATIADGATRAVTIESFQNSYHGTNATIARLKVGKTNSVSIFCSESGAKVTGNILAGSMGEVSLRFSPNGTTNLSPDDVVIDGNTINSAGTNDKGAVELRQLGKRCKFTGNTLDDYLRVGQGSATSPSIFADGLLIQGNHWPTLHKTIPLHLMLMAGVTALVTDNDFLVDAVMQTASISAPTAITFAGNRRHCPVGVTPRAQLWNPANNRPGGVPIDGGGNVVVHP